MWGSTYTVKGSTELGALVKAWRDSNENGLIDAGEQVVASQQMNPYMNKWTINVPVQPGRNLFLMTATDAAGNQSAATRVPLITRR
jgi:hypothetical protein